MQKDELLHVHMLMSHIRNYCEGIAKEEIRTERYKSLEISPVHLHKRKHAHKDALLMLGEEIVHHIHGRSPLPVVTGPQVPVPPLAAAEN
jgi:hypothetical protein